MSLLRSIGKGRLLLLGLIVIAVMYFSARDGDWWGLFVLGSFFILLLGFYDVFRIEGNSEKHPHVTFSPSRRLRVVLLAVMGMFSIANSIAGLTIEVSVGGLFMLVVGFGLVWSAYNFARGRS
jgi:hypothetical protein